MTSKPFGAEQAHYRASVPKIILNITAALLLILVAVSAAYLANNEQNNLFFFPAVAAFLGGATILFRTFMRNIAHGIKVYEKGVEVIVRGRSKRYFYEQISGVRIAADEARKSHTYLTSAYEFFDEESEIFTVDPVYPNWRELGDTLVQKVAEVQAMRDVERIQNGYEAIYDEFTSTKLARGVVIKVNLQGVVEQGKKVLPWERTQGCSIMPDDQGTVFIRDDAGNDYAHFSYYNTINSIIALKTIDAMAKLRG